MRFDPADEKQMSHRTPAQSAQPHTPAALPATGRIDIHSHLLPGIDDGCQSFDESLACIRRLKEMGYIGTVCTPHIWPDAMPANMPANIAQWVDAFRKQLTDAGVEYHVWPGGELQLFEGAIDWMQAHGVPRLAGSRCVLLDYWGHAWPKWANDVFRYLLGHGYQPVLAHPERLPFANDLDRILKPLEAMGVWLQGNFRCMTGEEGFLPDRLVRELLNQRRYRWMALDMHGPDSLEGRFDGMSLLAAEYGDELLDRFTIAAPRRDILRM
jgi:protein-tyrosine phosphatase